MENENQSQGQTQKCPKCREEIQSSAKKCKHCQADIRNWFVKHKILTGILILFVIGIVGSIGGGGDDKVATQVSKNDTAKQEVEPTQEEKTIEPEKLTPEIIATSAEIAKEYSENEVAADEKYKGKIIEISGKITGVDNGILDNEFIVKLSDGEYDFSGPWCYMKPSEKEKVIDLKKEQQVTLIGKGDSATIGSPILKDCVVK